MENEENPEAPVDPGFGARGYTEQDYEGHRAHTMFFGVHVPNRRSHRRHKGSQKQVSGKGSSDPEKQSNICLFRLLTFELIDFCKKS